MDTTALGGAAVPPGERQAVDWVVPVTEELRAHLLQFQSRLNQWVAAANVRWQAEKERWRAEYGDVPGPYYGTGYREFDDELLATVFASLEAGRVTGLVEHRHLFSGREIADWARSYLASPLLGPAGLTIVLTELGLLLEGKDLSNLATSSYNALFHATGRPDLLEVSDLLDGLGLDGPELVFRHYSHRFYAILGVAFPPEGIAPFVEANLKLVMDVLTQDKTEYWINASAPFTALGTLTAPPPFVVDTLFAVALGTRKTQRPLAQDALGGIPGMTERCAEALTDGKADVRTSAAQWLGRRRDPAAIPALEVAVRRERQDGPKGAMLDALEALGEPVEKYLDRGSLAKQAAKVLSKGLPKELDWLRWDAVPSVRWADSGELIPLAVLQLLAAQAVKTKSPEPNVLLRKYCALFDPADREAFGQYLLEAWMAEDLRPIELDEARRLAAQHAGWAFNSMQSWPQGHVGDPLLGRSIEEIEAHYLPMFARRPAGSAISSKGLLALAAACARERAAAPVARYLKEWYGQRAAQGRALIAMLAWVDHPSSTQLMLSVGSRFRTKSFQEEATKQAEALAERKGWTMGELADRTIPTAGFDESGVIELSYGERTFAAVLRPDLTIELRSPDGKKLGSLPAPRQSEDDDLVKTAKKTLSLAKKELKSIVQLQTQRLYEALCTERTWLFDDWQLYLNRHPVVRHLTQRLAWVATTADGRTVVRPLDDGTLTDVDDAEVKLPPDAVMAVAHDTLLDPATVSAWQEHLADYEIEPLFQQLGKGTFELPADAATLTESADFTGHLVETFALRSRAGKLGYTRGETGDGGWFHEYEKRFPTLGLTTVIAFTGNSLPERNRQVALTTLRFQRTLPNGPAISLTLGEVPTVLLSEAHNDMRLMASDGTGFDPDWEKKVD